jgi:hypothetical protein
MEEGHLYCTRSGEHRLKGGQKMIGETTTRVQKHTPTYLNERVIDKIRQTIKHYAENPEGIEERLKQLDREWDMERVLEANASSLVILGIILGTFVQPWFYLISFLVVVFLLQHAIQGWCPPIRLFRRMGFRTHSEIATEHYALRLLRGDFNDLSGISRGEASARAERAFQLAKW